MPDTAPDTVDYHALLQTIRQRSRELGFQQLGVSGIRLDEDERHLQAWLKKGFHGEMDYMARHGLKRSRPARLVENTCRVISVRMDYLPPAGAAPDKVLSDAQSGYVSRYALGRDYHKLMRKRLQKLAGYITSLAGVFGYRVFVDSAPVLEKALAQQAGLGWIGKHSNLLNREAGSWFFLGEIYTDLPLPLTTTTPQTYGQHCGDCTACLAACPTGAIVAPFQVDARRCISYLTIELHGPIPEVFRRAMGNRIYGCDDCQLCCPWNRFARPTPEADFLPRHGLDKPDLLEWFLLDEAEFLRRTEGSPIRRIGHRRWLRNVSVALGNFLGNFLGNAQAPPTAETRASAPKPASTAKQTDKRITRQAIHQALTQGLSQYADDAMLSEHFHWALAQDGHDPASSE